MILNIKGGDNVARCEKCSLKNSCFSKGEFVGSCIAEKYLSMGGNKYYSEFKSKLVSEINFYLKAEKIPEISELFKIPGEYINLKYPFESGEKNRVFKKRYGLSRKSDRICRFRSVLRSGKLRWFYSYLLLWA